MGRGVQKGGGRFCHSNTDHKWGQSLILKVSEHPTTGTFSWPLHSACDYPTDPLFSPWPSWVPQKPHILISFAILTSKVSGTAFLSILARQKGFQVRNPPSRGGSLGFKKYFFFPPHYRNTPKNYFNSSPRDKTLIQKDTRTPMFIGALFTIVKTWKQPKYSSTDEWIKKMWYIYKMEYNSVIKRMK